MRLLFLSLQLLGILALCMAARKDNIRWCVWAQNNSKCRKFHTLIKKEGGTPLSCTKKDSYRECFEAVENKKADFMIIDDRLIFDALQHKHLWPIVSEVYGTLTHPRKEYYAVALVKKSSKFQMNQLKGVKSCHTAHKGYSGWVAPISFLSSSLKWDVSSQTLDKTVAQFFSASCVPCANIQENPSLCHLCKGKGSKKCMCTTKEPFYGFTGAFRCLQDGHGEVAFVRGSTVFDELTSESERNEYELLCPDNTRKPIDKFQECNLGKTASSVMISRPKDPKESMIWNFLSQKQKKHGKGTSEFIVLKDSWKDLLFSKAAIGFSRISNKDLKTYLTSTSLSAYQNLTLIK